jgi:ferric-dicitrate binding protein FerR (iron transport regulator)
VSKRNRRRPGSARTRRQQGSSLLIPIVVGLVVVAMVVGIILSVEGQTPTTANTLQDNTALPLNTGSMPNPDVPRISLEETQTRLEQGQAILIDVRSSDSFVKSHAQGAISIPEEEMGARLDELPHDKEIILYCT